MERVGRHSVSEYFFSASGAKLGETYKFNIFLLIKGAVDRARSTAYATESCLR